MARTRKVSDKLNNVGFEQNQDRLTPEERLAYDEFAGAGYYINTTLEDVINNFIVSHVGEGKVLPKVPRHEVAFWAQRGVQEFNYDILLSEKNIELELSPSLSIVLPSDYVNYVKLTWVDLQGNDRTMHPARHSTAKQGLLQDSAYGQIYDTDGNRTAAGKSETTLRFQDRAAEEARQDQVRENQYGTLGDDLYDFYYSGYFGRRYGNDPQFENGNGFYQIDTSTGIIYFGSSFSEGDIVSLRYISDGLGQNGDLATVYIPKMAEDALYAWLLYHLTKVRMNTAQLAPLYQKEMRAKMRNAKIRMSNYKVEEIAQVMRGRAKWIKH